MLYGALAWRFFQPHVCGAKALFLKHYAEKLGVPTGLIGPSLLQQMSVFKLLLLKLLRDLSTVTRELWRLRHTRHDSRA
jgi:hypothetical protein